MPELDLRNICPDGNITFNGTVLDCGCGEECEYSVAFVAGVHYSTGEIQCAWFRSVWGRGFGIEDIAEILVGSWFYLNRNNTYEDYQCSEILELKCFETASEASRFLDELSIWFEG